MLPIGLPADIRSAICRAGAVMDSNGRHSAFTNEELSVLKRAFDQACADLGLAKGRMLEREHLAVLIFPMATGGAKDGAELCRKSVARFRLGTPWEPIERRYTSAVALLDGRADDLKQDRNSNS